MDEIFKLGEMLEMVEKIHKDTKSLESRIHNTFLQYFQHSLNLATLVNHYKRTDHPMEFHCMVELMYIGTTFKNFCELFSSFRNFTKVQIVNQDSGEAYEISLKYKKRFGGNSYFLDDEQLLNFQGRNRTTIWMNKIQDFKLSYASSVDEDFKSFSENVKDLHGKCENNREDIILQHEERVRELEEKYKDYRIAVYKDTMSMYEDVVNKKKQKFDKKYCETDMERETYGIVHVVLEKFNI